MRKQLTWDFIELMVAYLAAVVAPWQLPKVNTGLLQQTATHLRSKMSERYLCKKRF